MIFASKNIYHRSRRLRILSLGGTVPGNNAPIVNVEKEDFDDMGRLRLTFSDETAKYIRDDEDAIEEVYREILLRDPIVRGFIEQGDDSSFPFNRADSYPMDKLLSMIIKDPPRIAGTRWTIENVQNDYVTEAWESVDNKSWIPSKEFTSADAARAALLIFYNENEASVKARMRRLIHSTSSLRDQAILDSEVGIVDDFDSVLASITMPDCVMHTISNDARFENFARRLSDQAAKNKYNTSQWVAKVTETIMRSRSLPWKEHQWEREALGQPFTTPQASGHLTEEIPIPTSIQNPILLESPLPRVSSILALLPTNNNVLATPELRLKKFEDLKMNYAIKISGEFATEPCVELRSKDLAPELTTVDTFETDYIYCHSERKRNFLNNGFSKESLDQVAPIVAANIEASTPPSQWRSNDLRTTGHDIEYYGIGKMSLNEYVVPTKRLISKINEALESGNMLERHKKLIDVWDRFGYVWSPIVYLGKWSSAS
ncbi:LOW QUALITY PROTEIN: hypothetical protein BC938DRAFT_475011 [Jimgerdemannia flammicorona]|uniref:Uncharacterized protein n=1 Tax=Jimgerdemannia flammicorona TaxID=994334 RepID=A0A433Q131_9FUNG|nr:LOW QUALITY PROTEIN: hypothetical protein BC938DRAFT_475011 [Jimgerdemannia flammicorona]